MMKFKNLSRPRNKIDKDNDSEQLPMKRKCQRLHYSPSRYDNNDLSYEDTYSTLQDEWSKQKPKKLLIATMKEHQTWVKATAEKCHEKVSNADEEGLGKFS